MIDNRLTAAELDELIRRNRVPRIPRGCDQQGRYPQAAEACTEVGADDDGRNDAPLWRVAVDELLPPGVRWSSIGRGLARIAWGLVAVGMVIAAAVLAGQHVVMVLP